jgi:phosphatidylserine/phosphatidylglycerophosphate/cardiolipin synthase-like enzyme
MVISNFKNSFPKIKKFIGLLVLFLILIIITIFYFRLFEKKIKIDLSASIPIESSPPPLNLKEIVDIKDAFKFLLTKSEKSIYVAGLYFTSNINREIIKNLKRAIKRGVKIKFLLQDSEFAKSEFKKLNIDKFTNVEVRFVDVSKLGETKWGDFHNKYVIFDEKYAVLGSANFSYPAFNSNIEISALIVDKEIVKQLTEIFFRDYEYTYNKIPIFPQFYFISASNYLSKNNITLVESVPPPLNSPDILDMEDAVQYLLDNAQNEILLEIYAFTSNETNYPLLYNSLVNAHKRNVNVKIIVDNLIYTQNEYAKYAIDKLQMMGLNIKKIKLTEKKNEFNVDHSKLLIVDKKYVLISSCNFSKSGFKENREIGIVTTYTQIVYPLYKKFLLTFESKYCKTE